MKTKLITCGIILASFAVKAQPQSRQNSDDVNTLSYPDERHFKNIQQLTFGGDNAEAYFGFDNEHIVFQRTNLKEGLMCDQIFYGAIPSSSKEKFNYKLVSTGKGKTTCAYLMPDRKQVIYASTHLGARDCPPVPDKKALKKYVWPIHDSYDIFIADLNGKVTQQVTTEKGYDAEATISQEVIKLYSPLCVTVTLIFM